MSLKCEWKLYLCVHHYVHQGLTRTSDHGYCQRCCPNYCCLHRWLYFDTFNTNWYILKKGSIVFHQQSFSVIVVTYLSTLKCHCKWIIMRYIFFYLLSVFFTLFLPIILYQTCSNALFTMLLIFRHSTVRCLFIMLHKHLIKQ